MHYYKINYFIYCRNLVLTIHLCLKPNLRYLYSRAIRDHCTTTALELQLHCTNKNWMKLSTDLMPQYQVQSQCYYNKSYRFHSLMFTGQPSIGSQDFNIDLSNPIHVNMDMDMERISPHNYYKSGQDDYYNYT